MGLTFLPPPLSMFMRCLARLYLVPPLKGVKKSERDAKKSDRNPKYDFIASIYFDANSHLLRSAKACPSHYSHFCHFGLIYQK